MDKKRNVWKWIALIFIIAAVGAAGILIGRYITDSKYRAEQELNFRLNRLIRRNDTGGSDGQTQCEEECMECIVKERLAFLPRRDYMRSTFFFARLRSAGAFLQGIHEAGTGEFVKQCEISLNNLKNSLDSCRSLAIINIYFYIFLNGSYAGDENVLKANTSGKQQDVTITNDQCVEKSYRVRWQEEHRSARRTFRTKTSIRTIPECGLCKDINIKFCEEGVGIDVSDRPYLHSTAQHRTVV